MCPLLLLVVVAIERGAFGLLSTTVANSLEFILLKKKKLHIFIKIEKTNINVANTQNFIESNKMDEIHCFLQSKQLDIKLGPFTQKELDSVLRKIRNRKVAGLEEIPPEVWKTRQFDDIQLRHCNAVYNQNSIDRWMKGCILPFPKKGDLGLAKNYRGITLTSIVAKIYNALLQNRIEPKIDNILRKNQNGFRRNRSTTSQILTIRRILEGVWAKNVQATLLFVDFTKVFDSIHRGRWNKSYQHTVYQKKPQQQ